MIELDLFGQFGKGLVKTFASGEFYPISSSGMFLSHPIELDRKSVTVEELDEIPRGYRERGFAGRISFYDEDTEFVREIFWAMDYDSDTSGMNVYEVVKGYFPPHLEFHYREIDRWLDKYFGFDEYGDVDDFGPDEHGNVMYFYEDFQRFRWREYKRASRERKKFHQADGFNSLPKRDLF
jgi:hypothetical protein